MFASGCFVLLLFASLQDNQAQQWDWARSFSRKNMAVYAGNTIADRYNNLYCPIRYSDSLFLTDTTFGHPVNSQYTINVAILKLTPTGRFVTALDIYTTSGNGIYSLQLAVDDQMNLYISCVHDAPVYIQDSVVYPSMRSDSYIPTIFLAKLNQGLQVVWIQQVTSPTQGVMHDMILDGQQHLCIATGHYPEVGKIDTVVYFGQDTAVYSSYLNSILRLNQNGQIIWRKEIRNLSGAVEVGDLFLGENQILYCRGTGNDDFLLQGDTIRCLFPNLYLYIPFIVSFDTMGTVQSAEYIYLSFSLLDMAGDQEGGFYISATFPDTLILGQDTLIPPENTFGSMIGKLTPDWDPVWYETVYSGVYTPWFRIVLRGDSLFYTGTFRKTFTWFGYDYDLGFYSEAMTGAVHRNGTPGIPMFTNCNYDLTGTALLLDHCGDLYLGGGFRKTACFGTDTLRCRHPYYTDGFMAKSTRSVPQAMELGPDTSGCASLTLHGPPGYTYYRWNDTLGEDSVLIVFHTGIYWLAAAHEDLCWTYDTVQVVIDSLPDILLGEDTIIHRKDSLILVLPDGCNQYLWSTGETTATLILRGWELGTGSHLLWGEAVRGACIDRDTLLVSVIGNPGVWESRSLWPRVYPNPTTGIVTISEEGPEVIWTIYDLSGRVLYNGVTEGRPSALRQIDLSGLLPGLYLLELEQVQRRVRIKLIKR